MKFICDFHIHSHYSRATSKQLVPEYLSYWAALKGIKVVGTGDFTHPGWARELKEKLEPAEPGLFRIKREYRDVRPFSPAGSCDSGIRFLLTSEISSIYKKNGKIRKVHNVIFAPDFETVEKIQKKLIGIKANITSDGRPILGLDSRDLLEMMLDVSGRIFFVPAHIWTPWFSILGSKSGFDSIEECFGDLTGQVFAVETGLSTDPPMHWMCSFLDRYTLISNSDAHSPEKLGRNANFFNTELSYDAIIRAMRDGAHEHFLGTIDLFPQEGKYHYDGHRKCGICWDPLETLRNREICPICGNRITVGVMNRVAQLSDREDLTEREKRFPFYSIIPLKELLAEIVGSNPASKQVDRMYFSLLQRFGSEFNILLDVAVDDIKKMGNEILSEAIRRMRNREVIIKEGFDGEYGRITVFGENEIRSFGEQESLFRDMARLERGPGQKREIINFDLREYRKLQKARCGARACMDNSGQLAGYSRKTVPLRELNPEQKRAVGHGPGPALVIAGPGTGKTRTLACRVVDLIQNRRVPPENILAVTFTNKAAEEMRTRLGDMLGDRGVMTRLQVSTFHSLGFSILKKNIEKTGRDGRFAVIDEADRRMILLKKLACESNRLKSISYRLTHVKRTLTPVKETEKGEFAAIFDRYERILTDLNVFDLDDLIYYSVRLFTLYPEIVSHYRELYQWILIDEYQDINFAQYQMIKKLMPEPDSNIYVIGDPAQAIYGFRGADVKFINRFIDDYPGAAVYRLNRSYRCSESILRASAGVIGARSTSGEDFLEGIKGGVKVRIVRNDTEKSEAEFIARTIEDMVGGVRFFSIDSSITAGEEDAGIESLSDFAVLCRIARQMEVLEKAFNDHHIPYQTVKDTPFFKQEPVRSIMDLLKLSAAPGNGFLRDKLMSGKRISPAGIYSLKDLEKERTVRNRISVIIDKYFDREAEDKDLLERLLNLSAGFKNDVEGFIRFADLGAGVDTYRPDAESVTLMTLHAAKGLEFKCVFIAGCEDGLLPYSLFDSQRSDSEEERRLLYVGMTRAKKYLFLSHAEKRFIHNRKYRLKRSPYLDGIEKGLIEMSESGCRKKQRKKEIQPDLFDAWI